MRRALVLLLLLACGSPPQVPDATLSVQEALGGEVDPGYARADRPVKLQFPRDHGPHPEFRSEWWYFTGNLDDARGRHYGYQLTFFRSNLNPRMPERKSAWATNQLAMAHFALTTEDRFQSWERLSRAALGLAAFSPEKVSLGDWSCTLELPLRLRAGEALDLELTTDRPPVLHGEQGFSRKGTEEGQASYYVSYTRLKTRGKLNGTAVEGTSWMDHEWTSNALGREQTGWDWMGLQLDDGREIMLFRLRGGEGFSSGTLVQRDGTWAPLGKFELTALEHWGNYPSRWRLEAADLDLTITPVRKDQEVKHTLRYWEGAVRVTGSVEGVGYVELTGY